MELHSQLEMQSEIGRIFYNTGESPLSKTVTYIVGERIYQKTFGWEALHSRGLPHDKFHLAFQTGFETNIYQNTYSSYYVAVLPNKVNINITMRFALPRAAQQQTIEFERGQEEYPIELPRIEFEVDKSLEKIRNLQQNYSRLHQLAILNYFTIAPCDFSTQQMFSGQTWKNVPIIRFLETITEIEKKIQYLVDIFIENGRTHIIDDFLFIY